MLPFGSRLGNTARHAGAVLKAWIGRERRLAWSPLVHRPCIHAPGLGPPAFLLMLGPLDLPGVEPCSRPGHGTDSGCPRGRDLWLLGTAGAQVCPSQEMAPNTRAWGHTPAAWPGCSVGKHTLLPTWSHFLLEGSPWDRPGCRTPSLPPPASPRARGKAFTEGPCHGGRCTKQTAPLPGRRRT